MRIDDPHRSDGGDHADQYGPAGLQRILAKVASEEETRGPVDARRAASMKPVFVVAASAIVALALACRQERTHATRGEQLGAVHFPTSCNPAVAQEFDRAVALLHSFEFGAAIKGFTGVLATDSTCAMAQWGIALSHWGNPMAEGIRPPAQLAVGLAAANEAKRLGAHATAREQGYADAVAHLYDGFDHADQRTRLLAYEQAMGDLVQRQPADTEAMIFYALALTAAASPSDKSFAKQLQAGAILEKLSPRLPDHPGIAHYIIHAYDHPALAVKAEEAARRYAHIAPSAAHALHMPSHTFTRVGFWQESVESNRQSIDVALRAGSMAEALHGSDYAMYAYLQLRRLDDARRVLNELPALASRFVPAAVTGAAPGSAGVFALAAIPARWALERREWAEAARLTPTTTPFPWTEAMTHFARALGASHTGDLATARTSVDSLSTIQQRLTASGESYWAEQVAIQELGGRAWLQHAMRHDDSALVLLRQAADREDATEKSAVTPGPLAPARELLGDLLMELGRPKQALAEYEAALRNEPNRYHTLDGARRAASAAGDSSAAAALRAIPIAGEER
jgi:tetratricopeptide (TPR) repeat protein